jgi:hypothetical protein
MPDTSGNTPRASTPRPPFPWWLVGILGGGLLIVVGVVSAFFLHGNPLPGPGAFCAQQEPRCAQGLDCSEDNLCLRAEGAACSRDEECASHQCLQDACQAMRPAPRRPDGDSCAKDAQCLSGSCVDGRCR